MQTQRHYYTDAYTTQFWANVIDLTEENGRYAAILDETFFYPTSGGQPHDLGTLNQIPVIDVTLREDDSAVLHWLAEPFNGERFAHATIDWTRRFDHMQQHTGQHILSKAFIQIAAAETVGFHLTNDNLTIDLDCYPLTVDQLAHVESLANQVVGENQPVFIELLSYEEAQAKQVRKLPPRFDGPVRLIEIGSFDLTACGGTHVQHTGEVCLIKIIKQERIGSKTRITFLCGQRALSDYQQKHQIVADIATQLTTGVGDLPSLVARMQADLKQAQKENGRLQADLLTFTLEQQLQAARAWGPYRGLVYVWEGQDGRLLKQAGGFLAGQPDLISLLAMVGLDKTQLLFACGEAVTADMSGWLKAAIAELGNGSGGGRPTFAQGGTAVTAIEQIQKALNHIAQQQLPD